MPIDKPSAQASFLNKVGFGFTVLDNEALGVIGEAVAVAVWVHLCSKPQAWKVKEAEVCGALEIGRDRYRRAMRRLRDTGLVWDEWARSDGRIVARTINVTWTMAHAQHLKPENQALSNDQEYLKPEIQSVCNTVCKETCTLLVKKETTEKKESAVKKDPTKIVIDGSDDRSPKSTNIEATTTKEVQKRVNTRKPKVWHEFFEAYPANKKGGNDVSAWKAAKAMKLTDHDFEDMLFDVRERSKLNKEWVDKYALGITKYIRQEFWKTPIPKADHLTTEGLHTMDPHMAAFFEATCPDMLREEKVINE